MPLCTCPPLYVLGSLSGCPICAGALRDLRQGSRINLGPTMAATPPSPLNSPPHIPEGWTSGGTRAERTSVAIIGNRASDCRPPQSAHTHGAPGEAGHPSNRATCTQAAAHAAAGLLCGTCLIGQLTSTAAAAHTHTRYTAPPTGAGVSRSCVVVLGQSSSSESSASLPMSDSKSARGHTPSAATARALAA